MRKREILLVERNLTLRRRLSSVLARHGFAVMELMDSTSVLQTLRYKQCPDLLLMNVSLEARHDGLQVAQVVREEAANVPVILIAPRSSSDLIVAALRAGVADYLQTPFADDELIGSVERCFSIHPRLSYEAQTAAPPVPMKHVRSSATASLTPSMIGESPRMRDVKAYISRVAAAESNVLITGETGTGKELVAALIHQHSRRCRGPFIALNCAAIPDSLLESELFGYERGAFTGAERSQEGVLRSANGGTVFFDEVGDMSPYAQAKILRAIESRAIRRIGGKDNLLLDIRIVAATNRNLEQLIVEEKFRTDLYFRLKVANIYLPPLRERKEDLLTLVNHYVRQMNRQFERHVEGLTDEALEFLLRYNWPGNVRELKNLIEAVFINLPPNWIAVVDLPEEFRKRVNETADLPQDERNRLLQALFATNWNKRLAAQKLHWSRMTLYRKMAKYQVLSGGKEGRLLPSLLPIVTLLPTILYTAPTNVFLNYLMEA